MPAIAARDVEPVGLRENPGISIGRVQQSKDTVSGGDDGARLVEAHVLERYSGHRLRRALVAQHLLDGFRCKGAILPERRMRRRMSQQRKHTIAHQVCGGLVPCEQQQDTARH